ncbi:DNA recombination and repair protein RecF [Psychrobacter nivimaris]|uniref:DNA replication and repair protein RecF n=1 Tax=Psychrobacter nivimaris TaxID=281738 RepID=A0A6N7C3N0_9GAMM|nr:DNA replication and repair protein RecF [Psychrobacter nivimaris]KAF0569893.1 DNA recombination and repair protein RecF [Psychrobacter nivimaris]
MIERLQISHLRNLTKISLEPAACNIIIGANGSGKTSLLESIFLLSRGKSFRHHQPKRYIQHHQNNTTVHAKLNDSRTLAIQKQADATTILRLNQTTVYNQSILTEQLPTLLIDPSTMDMLEQGSASRRQLLDWLVFHMKQGFHPQWMAYQRLLKQRNSLLKRTRHLTQVQLSELKSWDKGLSNHAALIHHYREQVFTEWQPYFAKSIVQLLPSYAEQLSLSYNAGYDTSVALDVQLNERLEQDLQLGYTRIGNHRADIHVHWRSDESISDQTTDARTAASVNSIQTKLPTLKEQAANVLSRGEKKLLITSLRLSQLPLLLNDRERSDSLNDDLSSRATPVVLLDDITAELDDRAIEILLSTLAKLPCQVFMTSLADDILPLVHELWLQPNTFHVKQGKISFTN